MRRRTDLPVGKKAMIDHSLTLTVEAERCAESLQSLERLSVDDKSGSAPKALTPGLPRKSTR
jgi:hypothetical protein